MIGSHVGVVGGTGLELARLAVRGESQMSPLSNQWEIRSWNLVMDSMRSTLTDH